MTNPEPLDLASIRRRHRAAVDHVSQVTGAATDVWRLVQSDSESIDAIAPTCTNPGHQALADRYTKRFDAPGEVMLDFDCCPDFLIETHHETVAAFLATAFADVPALITEIERLRQSAACAPKGVTS
jgi:hypothetical protein